MVSYANTAAISGNKMLDDACAQVLLDMRAASPNLRSFVMTGCRSGDGVTTLCCAMARAALRLDLSRVLLIDVAPSAKGLTATLAPGAEKGLRQFPSAGTDVVGLVRPDGPRLDILPLGAGNGPVLPTNDDLAALLEQTQKTYDLVIWDTAPIAGSVSTVRLSRLIGAVVLVTETDRTQASQVIAALNQTRAIPAEPLAVVRNRAGRAPFGFKSKSLS